MNVRAKKEHQRLQVVPVLTHDLQAMAKTACEQHPDYEPSWFVTLTFYQSSGARHDRDWAIATFHRYCIAIAKKTNGHGIPVAAIGKTDKGDWHLHMIWLHERNRRKPKYEEMRSLWWGGYKKGSPETSARGRAHAVTYDPNRAAVVYTLQHPYYIPIHKPFCPGRAKCRPVCVKQHKHTDIIRGALRVKAKKTTGRFSTKLATKGADAPL